MNPPAQPENPVASCEPDSSGGEANCQQKRLSLRHDSRGTEHKRSRGLLHIGQVGGGAEKGQQRLEKLRPILLDSGEPGGRSFQPRLPGSRSAFASKFVETQVFPVAVDLRTSHEIFVLAVCRHASVMQDDNPTAFFDGA